MIYDTINDRSHIKRKELLNPVFISVTKNDMQKDMVKATVILNIGLNNFLGNFFIIKAPKKVGF